jgi:hypothetical protein
MLEQFGGTPHTVGELGHKLGMDTGTITRCSRGWEKRGGSLNIAMSPMSAVCLSFSRKPD